MANNRMCIVHKPTGYAVWLGKRMAVGWYCNAEDIQKELNDMYNLIEKEEGCINQDDFVIALELNKDSNTAYEYNLVIGEEGHSRVTLVESNG